jgi:SAM-dependent methyltransferase
MKRLVEMPNSITSFIKQLVSPTIIIDNLMVKEISRIVKELGQKSEAEWLDLGCGAMPYRKLFKVKRYVGVDVEVSGFPKEQKSCDVYYDGVNIPFGNALFDGIICTEVLEHVAHTDKFLSEIHRVLKPGASLILTVPFVWQEHESPYDYYRYTSFGLKQLMADQGFRINKYLKVGGSLETIAQTSSAYICRNLMTKIKILNIMIIVLLCLPIQYMGLLLQRILPDNKELFIVNMLVAEKI